MEKIIIPRERIFFEEDKKQKEMANEILSEEVRDKIKKSKHKI